MSGGPFSGGNRTVFNVFLSRLLLNRLFCNRCFDRSIDRKRNSISSGNILGLVSVNLYRVLLIKKRGEFVMG